MVDEGDFPETAQQTTIFTKVVHSLDEAGIHPRWIHLAGSSGAIYAPETRFNLVRTGCAILGIAPRNTAPLPPELRRTLSWKTHIASCKVIPMGRGIGYGHTYTTPAEEVIGVLPVGYSDGFRRLPGNEVIIDGKKVPIVGKICMDMSMVRLPKIHPMETEAVIIGSQGTETIFIEDLVARWKISEVDVVSNINLRVPRIYIRE
jgi:alanine racemase